MNRSIRILGALVGGAACTLAIGACSATETRVESTTTTSVAAATTLPSGAAAELLPRLLAGLSGLSLTIGGDGDEDQLMTDAEQLWSAARDEVEADDPAAAGSIDEMMALARRGVTGNRPADADKAYKFLTLVIDEYLATR